VRLILKWQSDFLTSIRVRLDSEPSSESFTQFIGPDYIIYRFLAELKISCTAISGSLDQNHVCEWWL